jgi:hypothetical protein
VKLTVVIREREEMGKIKKRMMGGRERVKIRGEVLVVIRD